MEYALELKNVAKNYEDFSLQDVNIALPEGAIMGLIGENGAGKSVTIKLILDLISRDGGTINILGRDNKKDLKQIKENIGVVLDESCFTDNLDLRSINLIMKNIYRTWDEDVFMQYAKRFSLSAKKIIKNYSRGMKMKLALAVALSHDTKLLILDEATSGLDPIIREEILDVFLDFIQDEKRSIFISSHIISDLEKICDYITFIHQGKIIFSENKDDLLDNFGILKCSATEFEAIDKEYVKGFRKNSFGVEALVFKNKIAAKNRIDKAIIDRASIEDIMLYHIMPY